MRHVPDPIKPIQPHQDPARRAYTIPPRMPESPFKPTSSLRHRRQSSTVTSTGLTMSPSSYIGDAEFRGNSDVEAASRFLGEAMGGEVGRRVERSNTDEELGRIAQAMVLSISHYILLFLFFLFAFSHFLTTFANADRGGGKKKTLLSLHPTSASGVQFPPVTASGSSAPPCSTGATPWPSPEELLKESLRQSLSALHALGRIKSLVDNLPAGVEEDKKEGERGIAQIMGFYDRAVGEMKAAGEVLVLGPVLNFILSPIRDSSPN